MPRTYCAVYGCFNSATSKPELSYFKLPSDFERRSQWLRLISREDLKNKPPQNYTVCEDHFNAMDILTRIHRKKLKINALPSLHLPDLQKKDVHEAPKLVEICTQTEKQNQDLSSGNEIKVFCPNCNTEVSHTAEGIREDQTKLLVAKVYHYFEQEYEELKKIYGDLDLTPLSKFRQRTALATGVSEATLLQILKEEEERNAEKRREPSQKRRAARKRRRQTDSSSGEGSSDDNDEEIEQPTYAEEVQTLVVKMEPPEYTTEEPEIFIPTEVKLELGDSEISKEDPISVDVKAEPRDDTLDTADETLALNETAATKRRRRKISKKTDDSSTRQLTPGEYSAPVASSSVPVASSSVLLASSSVPLASSSVPLAETLTESGLPGEREIKMEEIEIQEEGLS